MKVCGVGPWWMLIVVEEDEALRKEGGAHRLLDRMAEGARAVNDCRRLGACDWVACS